jgi:hypothetical protein
MAQVNSSPGAHPAAGTVAVASAVAAPGASDSRTKAAANTVSYNQNEPGANKANRS